MIKINLIPPELVAKKEEARLRSKAYLAFFLLIVVLALVAIFEYQRVAGFKAEIAKINREIEKIAPEASKAKAIQKDIKAMTKEVHVLFSLLQKQTLFSRALDELSKILPEHIWLTRIFLDQENLRLSGTAESVHSAEVYDFVHPLENSLYFKAVQPPTPSNGMIGDTETINFNMNCKNEFPF